MPDEIEDVVFLGDLDATLLGVEAGTHAGPSLIWPRVNCSGLLRANSTTSSQVTVPPSGARRVLRTFGGPSKRRLEALDEDGAQGLRAEVEGETLVAVEHACIVLQQLEQGGKRILDGTSRRKVIVQLDEPR